MPQQCLTIKVKRDGVQTHKITVLIDFKYEEFYVFNTLRNKRKSAVNRRTVERATCPIISDTHQVAEIQKETSYLDMPF